MDCRVVERLLPGFLDGELDLVHHQQVEHHLAECSACSHSYQQLRSLQSAITSMPLYYKASSSLRNKVEELVRTTRPERMPTRQRFFGNNLINIAAGILLLALVGVVLFIRQSSKDPNAFADEVLANHLRSLQVDHLTDLVSADPEKLKAWFVGKVDFSPEVVDLSDQGYALSGVRLDVLEQQVVAVVVYRSQDHVINLFTAPSKAPLVHACTTLDFKGHRLRHWDAYGSSYWAISGLGISQFDEFIGALTEKISHTCLKRMNKAE